MRPGDRRAPPGPAAGPPSLLHTIVVWLTEITTWHRASIALVLGGALLVGVLVYEHPQRVFELATAVVERRGPTAWPYMTPLYTEVRRELEQLLAIFGPTMIGVTAWRIELLTNRQTLVAHAVLPEFEPMVRQLIAERWRWPVAAFGDDPAVNDVFGRLYIGRFVCTAPTMAWQSLARFPIAEICLVAIPPEGYGLAGLLGGAWREPVPAAERPRIEAAFRGAAARMVWRPRAAD